MSQSNIIRKETKTIMYKCKRQTEESKKVLKNFDCVHSEMNIYYILFRKILTENFCGL